MSDGYRQRCTNAALRFVLDQQELTSTSQITWVGTLVDAVLAERDGELAALRQELETVIDRMEADRLKHRAERDIWKECDERQWRHIRAAETEVARLRAGEAPEPAPDGTWSTPPQWIRHWNMMPANVRLAMADQILRNAQAAHDCAMAHGLRAPLDGEDTDRG